MDSSFNSADSLVRTTQLSKNACIPIRAGDRQRRRIIRLWIYRWIDGRKCIVAGTNHDGVIKRPFIRPAGFLHLPFNIYIFKVKSNLNME
ncbi:hypothetical protein BDA96_08G206900 [Sorghum bicolor]|uniref:Uncharacterized protein n=2 Tax=Sorghum bicolor TaxID=4558 RepID=A0A921QH94_SORBI|nr:hypothetical protein BDA96_08G206900 [Sorghum bicolor]OQU79731.1 hypothetical protein SORBI_3008G188950 [Sorghum bicolor]